MSFAVFTDTSANLPTARLRQCQMQLVPFSYIVDGQAHQCMDLDAFDAQAYYAGLKNKAATTSMINAEIFAEAWEPYLKTGVDVLYVGMSSGISGSFSASCAAAQRLLKSYPERRIVTFDTLAASLGEGLQALYAARLQREGKSLEETVAALEVCRAKMHQVFTVDDLLYLHRGGRVSRTTAIAGTVLNIKPILQGDEAGKIVVTGKSRGRKNAVRRLADNYIAHADEAAEWAQWPVGIAHAGCVQDARTLASYILEKTPDKQIMIVDYEPVTGSHVGPGALALFYIGDAEKIPAQKEA